ncbi:lantibiotic dehydratase [Kutzneria sp. NPDC052558]|uniref:lantibiotic dehydratase n=1 Tax=Kutzneria sp. NPDC052558 TaxID=3364121 RepID=UPI0037C7CC1E
MKDTDDQPHLLPLADSGWSVWRDFVLRGAGFPVTDVLRLSAPELTTAHDLDAAWPAEIQRLADSVREVAADPRFREAVAWQNPTVVRTGVEKVARPAEPGRPTAWKHIQLVANYLQRYTVKNDTIGFFGPASWGQLTDDDEPIRFECGPGLVADRTVYIENWAVDTLAWRLSEWPAMQPWLRPALSGGMHFTGEQILRPYRDPIEVPRELRPLLEACDGARTVRQIAAELPAATEESVLAALQPWLDDDIVHLTLRGPIEAHPEDTLRERLLEIGDAEVLDQALSTLDELVRGRDVVSAAAGDPDKLMAASAELDETFRRVTGADPVRRHGEMYAGRTLLYEDARRDVRLDLGRPVLAAIGAPLGLVADSARWFVARAGRNYLELFGKLVDRHAAANGGARMPLSQLLGMATPHLVPRNGRLPAPVDDAVSRLQAKWTRILQVPAGVHRHTVTADEIREAVRREFPATTPMWATARHHSPDLMIAAATVEAIRRGEFDVVLGELHLATNTLESRLFVERHPNQKRLLAAAERDHGGRRFYTVPTKDSPLVNSRTYPAALLSPQYHYWCLHDAGSGAPGPVLPSAALEVHRDGDRLLVSSRTGEGPYDLLEVLAEQVSAAVVGAFQPLPPGKPMPRISVDRLVIHRETWTFTPAELAWAFVKTAAARFRAAQEFRAAHDMPVRTFCRIHTERKPVLLDFTSVPLLEQVAKAVRKAAKDDAVRHTLTISEMLPDVEQSWLSDADGATYTSEIRMVLVDPLGADR